MCLLDVATRDRISQVFPSVKDWRWRKPGNEDIYIYIPVSALKPLDWIPHNLLHPCKLCYPSRLHSTINSIHSSSSWSWEWMGHVWYMPIYGARSRQMRGVLVRSHYVRWKYSFVMPIKGGTCLWTRKYTVRRNKIPLIEIGQPRLDTAMRKHLSCIHTPLLNVEVDSIVVDELYGDSRDHTSWEHQWKEANHLRQLEQAITSRGVSFQIWQKQEPTGKPIHGSYEWTAVAGKHKLQVLKMLPEKMSTLLEESISHRVAALWKVYIIYVICQHKVTAS